MANMRRRLIWVSIGFWVLLAYIVAALVWWYIALKQQNTEMTALRKTLSGQTVGVKVISPLEANDLQQRKEAQYLGEGIIFLALILLGAFLVYRAIRSYVKLSQQQQTFMMAVTHELKTPIAVTRLQLETMQKHKLQEQQQQLLLSQAINETDRLNDLCNNILYAARFSGSTTPHQLQPINFSEQLQNWLKILKQRFSSHNVSAQIDDAIILNADPSLLELMVNNLVENAVKYSPAATNILVQLSAKNGRPELTVADEGVGIPPAEYTEVFKKFYRVGNEATRQTRGTGLGLFLVKRIAQVHHAQVGIQPNQPAGTIFTISFPAPPGKG